MFTPCCRLVLAPSPWSHLVLHLALPPCGYFPHFTGGGDLGLEKVVLGLGFEPGKPVSRAVGWFVIFVVVEIQFIYEKTHPLRVHKSVIFSRLAGLCNHPHTTI